MKANEYQIAGNHYLKFKDKQPWNILEAYLSDEQFEGYLLGSAIVYLLRSNHKASNEDDIRKAHHTLGKLIEVITKAEKEG
jgi:hypothetical protein